MSGRTLATGFGAGAAAAVVYAVIGLWRPSMPTTYDTVLLAMGLAGTVAGMLVLVRPGALGPARPGALARAGAGSGRPGAAGLSGRGEVLFAVLSGSAWAALLVGEIIDDLFGSLPGWVADNAPPSWVFGPAAPVRLLDASPSSLLGLLLLAAALVLGLPRRRTTPTRLPVDVTESWATSLSVSGPNGPDLV